MFKKIEKKLLTYLATDGRILLVAEIQRQQLKKSNTKKYLTSNLECVKLVKQNIWRGTEAVVTGRS